MLYNSPPKDNHDTIPYKYTCNIMVFSLTPFPPRKMRSDVFYAVLGLFTLWLLFYFDKRSLKSCSMLHHTAVL